MQPAPHRVEPQRVQPLQQAHAPRGLEAVLQCAAARAQHLAQIGHGQRFVWPQSDGTAGTVGDSKQRRTCRRRHGARLTGHGRNRRGVLRPLQAAACAYHIAFGPRSGQKVLTLQGAMPREKEFAQWLCSDIDSFSLHAAVRCVADDWQPLEQLCHYITCAALANERVQTNAAGQVVLKLKTACRDRTTHLVIPPLQFMQRLAALVKPRPHPIRFHGVPAPSSTTSAKLRAHVVPKEPETPTRATTPAQCEARCAHHRPVRLNWAELLTRVFDIDVEHCPNCGRSLKIIEAILEQPALEKIFTHLELQARAPPPASARGQALQSA